MKRRLSQAAGFTLVEILVVLTLMSVVMLALGAAMRTIAQTEERVSQRLQRSDELRLATSFLTSTLGRISPRKSPAPTAVGGSVALFSATSVSVMWVGVMPARHGAGGRHFFRLAVEPQAGDTNLVIRFAPWNGSGAFPDWASADSRVLAGGVGRLDLQYAQQDGSWRGDWTDPMLLPARIRISVHTPVLEWPQIILALRQLPAGDDGRGGFSLGPE